MDERACARGLGATVHFGKGKTTTTVGLPGTGMSYRSVAPSSGSSVLGVVTLLVVVLAAAAVAFVFL